uniref:L-lactate dehydrogenase n=1 Tax=Romanomermis culicivorax TaxID=13658 RepID=A0A915KGM7_ROMCU
MKLNLIQKLEIFSSNVRSFSTSLCLYCSPSFRGVCNELVMVDCMADKVKGEMLDLQHGSLFAKPCVINASSDYAVIANSTIVVVTAGARQKVGESRLELVNRNVDIFKGIISNIVKYAPNCLILIVSNPVDVMTYVTWKLSGFDRSRVIGSGTNLDTARFRFLLSEKLKISPKNCHGWIIGEHGDASVALWSCANVAGIPLHVMKRGKDFECDELHQQVIKSAYEVIKLKGYTNWAIGLSVSDICHNILRNSMAVLPLSVSAKGLHLIKEDVYLSLPCIVGSSGIVDVIEQRLDNKELEKLQNSANTLFDLQEKLHL